MRDRGGRNPAEALTASRSPRRRVVPIRRLEDRYDDSPIATTARRTDLQPASGYDGSSWRSPARLIDTTAWRSLRRPVVSVRRVVLSIYQAAAGYDAPPGLATACRIAIQLVGSIRRSVVTIARPPLDTTDRLIHRKDPRRERADKKRGRAGARPRGQPDCGQSYFSAGVDGSAAAAVAGCGAGVGAGAGPRAGVGSVPGAVSAFFRPRNGFTPNSASFSDRMP